MDGRGNKKMKTVQEAFQDVSDHQPQEAYYYSSSDQQQQQQPYQQQQQHGNNFTIIEQDDHHHNRTNVHGLNEGASSSNGNTNLQFEELSDGEEVMEDQQDFVHKTPHHEMRNYQQQQQGNIMMRNPSSFLVEEEIEHEDSEGEDESGNRYVRSTKTIINDAKSGQPQTQTKTTTKKVLGTDGRVISTSTSSKTVNLGSSGDIPVTMTSSKTVTSNGNGTSTTTVSSSSGIGGGFAPMQNPFSSGPIFNTDPFSNPFGNDPFFNDPFASMHHNMMNMQNNMRQQHLQAMQNMQNMQMGMHQPMFNSFHQPMFPQQGMTFGANQSFMQQPNNFPNQQQNFQQNYQQPPPQQQFPQNQYRR